MVAPAHATPPAAFPLAVVVPDAPTLPTGDASPTWEASAHAEGAAIPSPTDGPRFKLRVLRERCKDCIGGPKLATRCAMKTCPLWEYRTGHRPSKGTATRTPLRALRAYCLDCCLGQAVEVRLCPSGAPPSPCPLWPWRRGRRAGEHRHPPSVPKCVPHPWPE
jgi:hypothetical protein